MTLLMMAFQFLMGIGGSPAHAETAYGAGLRQANVCIYDETKASLACFDRSGGSLDKSPVTIDTSIALTIVELRDQGLFLRAGTATKLYFVRD